MKQREIMLVEDDESLGFLIKDALDAYGWKVNLYPSGEKGLTAFHNNRFDLCILDVMLPEKDGFTLATEIRKYNQQVPIVFLTAKSQTEDRIKGFQTGADDYVCKPFSVEEFKYRLEAIFRRTTDEDVAPLENSILKVSNSTLDVHNLMLDSNGTVTRLTHKECKLLQLFFRHTGKLIERDVFLKSIWEDDGFFVARSMDVFVSKLRKYLKSDTKLRIENIRSVGYILKKD
ncbi:response regulator transcription factor [Pseudochryseolinea flava]|uniref:DNA-binding response regulator n=1 Tax=Pseudochryseolinea flava TaxID=2059302 RepID=A0A364Y0P8_9BACT|nr:response regulator transcription factor [Pseudochryseolinea flava]RAW00382.1 DNA-binding response regulator [Pseudochryseolinea flava]